MRTVWGRRGLAGSGVRGFGEPLARLPPPTQLPDYPNTRTPEHPNTPLTYQVFRFTKDKSLSIPATMTFVRRTSLVAAGLVATQIASAVLIVDQIGGVGFVQPCTSLPNQYAPDLGIHNVVVDDFTTPAGAWAVNYFEVVARSTGATKPSNSAAWAATGPWEVRIYNDVSGTPGAVIYVALFLPGQFTVTQNHYALNCSSSVTNALLRFPMPVFLAGGTTYWVTVFPHELSTAPRQFQLGVSSFPANNAARVWDLIGPFPPTTGMNAAFRVDA